MHTCGWSRSGDKEVMYSYRCSLLLLLCLILKEEKLFQGDRKVKNVGQVQRARQGLRAVRSPESKSMEDKD